MSIASCLLLSPFCLLSPFFPWSTCFDDSLNYSHIIPFELLLLSPLHWPACSDEFALPKADFFFHSDKRHSWGYRLYDLIDLSQSLKTWNQGCSTSSLWSCILQLTGLPKGLEISQKGSDGSVSCGSPTAKFPYLWGAPWVKPDPTSRWSMAGSTGQCMAGSGQLAVHSEIRPAWGTLKQFVARLGWWVARGWMRVVHNWANGPTPTQNLACRLTPCHSSGPRGQKVGCHSNKHTSYCEVS